MNCDEFTRVMHQLLDQRRSLDDDNDLIRHACQCEPCKAQLDAWREIATVIPETPLQPIELPAESGFAAKAGTLLALAAVLLLAIGITSSTTHQDSPNVADPADRPHQSALAQSTDQVDPTLWWRSVQESDWVGQTMPTVKSMQEGVAPIGRSLRRALTILTIGGRDQTS